MVIKLVETHKKKTFIRQVVKNGFYENCTFIECYFSDGLRVLRQNRYIACCANKKIDLWNSHGKYKPAVMTIQRYQTYFK